MRNIGTRRLTQLGIFTAIIVLMAFTPLGYFRTPGLSVTLLHVPVLIAACVMGPGEGAVLGGVFGVTSFLQCFGLEQFGTALLGISPAATFVTCLLPRMLFGLIAGHLFRALSRTGLRKAAPAITGAVGTLCHTALFMGFLCLFFYRTDLIRGLAADFGTTGVFPFVLAFVGAAALLEALLGSVLTAAVVPVLNKTLRRGE